jgi:hypothetical protein
MTTHLSPDDFVTALERAPDGDIAEHLAACGRCRAEWEELRSGWDGLAAVEVPEPSPLFWDHFPSRVRQAVGDETPGRGAAWWASGRLLWAVGALAVVLLVVGVSLRAPSPVLGPLPPATGAEASVHFDEVADLFAALPPDEALAFAPAGTATWALVDDLTMEERAAFVRLVERELEALP